MGTVSAYLDGLEGPEGELIARIYAIARDVAPDAIEGTGYGMPALRYREQGFAAAMGRTRYIAVYPFSGDVLPALAADGLLEGNAQTKGALHCTVADPPSDELLRELFTRRKAEIDAKLA
ncbi:iron chaperone [Agromyces seonyuensis]|uniref:DUF1801 domain-containing protein n=1 Tax=Agromyces seonyuensis TaxID=2662446 RepID=A0A6I4NYD6_9MICO|nr:DUF1801 domain-containing protein [Agromyces seonyuensis]MWB99323.1 DUF1801 domain-containing protein [Agromyces seonyuensis]